ncbi:MAG: DUF368 domain-containing protein [Gammaproteobacteria bacterium]|nr:DUF368 domain-containing protein [Gammaproteobacteria bacterium]
MGTADIIPGVSGGTMALILGIYQQLIEAIRSFDLQWLRSLLYLDIRNMAARPHFAFLIPLLAGIAAALLFFTRVVPLPYLIEHYPEPVYGLFFGLILGSIVILIREFERDRIGWLFLLLATILGWWVFNLVPAETPDAGWFIFISGALAISAMLLPGISGSFILLLLKKYAYIFAAIGAADFSVIVPFALGMLAGLIAFSRLLSWLLRHYYRQALAAIIGLLVASLWVIWPYQQRVFAHVGDRQKLVSVTPAWPEVWTGMTILAVIMIITGFVAVLVLNHMARNGSAVSGR